jgi:hypothetical protein
VNQQYGDSDSSWYRERTFAMAVLNFTLSPESLGKLHDALVCLGKFNEAVCIEAVHDKVFRPHL